MNIIELSNHTRDKADALRQVREAKDEANLAGWKLRKSKADSLRRRRSAGIARAHRNKQWLKLAFLALFRSPTGVSTPTRPSPVQACDEEQRWLCGDTGEKQVAVFLARRLDDEWTLLQGYCNRRGEIDSILVGPGGIHAIEIKYQKGDFYCEEKRWTRDKYDRYGNKVSSRERVEDRKGRTPAQQLEAPAKMLQAYLNKPMAGIRVKTHVLFSHPESSLKSVIEPRMDSVSHITDQVLLDQLTRSRQILDQDAVCQVVALVRRSHANNDRGLRARRKCQQTLHQMPSVR